MISKADIQNIIDVALNDVVLDLYDLTIANAPLEARDQRQLADDLGRHVTIAKKMIADRIEALIFAKKKR